MTSASLPPPPAAPPPEPLGPDDFDALDHALDGMREHDPDIPQWEFCEGFMAALICSRRRIEPAEYWPMLLGDGFVPAQHMEFVWRWKRRWREIETGLDADVETLDDERAYYPELLDTRAALAQLSDAERAAVDEAQVPSYGQVWALGFLEVLDAFPDEWELPRDRETAGLVEEALEAIDRVAGVDKGKPTVALYDDSPPTVSQRRVDEVGAAIWAVYDLRVLWRSVGPRVPPTRRADTPGPNEPCFCGSGKKYKKCHGRA